MKMICITFRSITPAQQGQRVLQRSGVEAVLQRTPRWMEEKGCGYCLRIQTDRIGAVSGLLRKNAVDYRRVYLLHPDGETEEIRV